MDPADLLALLQKFAGSANGPQSALTGIQANPYMMGAGGGMDSAPAPQPPPYYLASQNAPLSYMMPGSPLNTPDPNQEAANRVNSLINGMEMQPGPTPPMHRSTGNKILGVLGDALANYGSIRAGGPARPIGPYGSGLEQERLRFQTGSDEAAKNNAAIRNQTRLAAFQSEQSRITAKEVAGIRASGFNRSMRPLMESGAIDIDGAPTQVTLMRDPVTRETVDVQIGGQSVMDDERIMEQIHRGIKGFAPTLFPGTEIGPDGQPRAAVLRIPKAPGGKAETVTGARGNRVEPLPPPALAAEAGGKEGVLSRIPDVVDVFNRAAQSVGGDEGYFNRVQNFLQSKAAKNNLGKLVGAPPELRDYYNSVKSVLFPIVKAGSGVNFSFQELDRWESRFPIPGYDSPEEAQHAWDVLVNEMITDIQSKYRSSGRQPPELKNPLAGKGGEDFSGKPPMTREMFNSMKPSEQKRWMDGGGKVGQ